MANLTTSKGKSYEVEFASAPEDEEICTIYMKDARRFPEIVDEFEALEWISYENEIAGRSYRWEGYTRMILLSADAKGGVQIRLAKES